MLNGEGDHQTAFGLVHLPDYTSLLKSILDSYEMHNSVSQQNTIKSGGSAIAICEFISLKHLPKTLMQFSNRTVLNQFKNNCFRIHVSHSKSN
jgi:hypothetical protein